MGGGERHVLDQRHVGEGPDQLVGHRQAPARAGVYRRPRDLVPIEAHLARAGSHDAGEQAHQGGLAGSVRSDETHQLALLHRDIDPANRAHPAEGDAQVPGFEQTHVSALREANRRAKSASPARPEGL